MAILISPLRSSYPIPSAKSFMTTHIRLHLEQYTLVQLKAGIPGFQLQKPDIYTSTAHVAVSSAVVSNLEMALMSAMVAFLWSAVP